MLARCVTSIALAHHTPTSWRTPAHRHGSINEPRYCGVCFVSAGNMGRARAWTRTAAGRAEPTGFRCKHASSSVQHRCRQQGEALDPTGTIMSLFRYPHDSSGAPCDRNRLGLRGRRRGKSNIFVGSGTDSEVNGGHEERRESQGGSQDGSAERGVGPRSTVLVNGEHETDGLGLEDYEADQSELEENEDKERELFPRDRREFDAAWSRAAATVHEEERNRNMDSLDTVYANMPQIQKHMQLLSGTDGVGTGYEDVQVGFYRDTNLKPTNWRDAMVSMKPGSGTKGLGLKPNNCKNFDEGLPWRLDQLTDRADPGEQEQQPKREGEDSDTQVELDALRQAIKEVERRRSAENDVPTQYGGRAPGEHGPWRWSQLEDGSPLKQKLEAEIASFPKRLPRKLRRYYQDRVVWVIGADGGLGERLAIHLTVNGARVIMSGMDLHGLERVQRLSILAWMKAVNWEIFEALLKGWTRLNRAMVLPLHRRDMFMFKDAEKEARSMLRRPVSMLFICSAVEYKHDDDDDDDDESEARAGAGVHGMEDEMDAMERDLWGAVGLTKAVLPRMVDKQEGHVVYVAGEESMVAPLAGFSAAEVASKHAARGFFDSLRAEVARDNVRVTLVHPQGRDGGSSSTSHETPQRLDPTLGHDQSPQQPVSPEERPLQDLFLEHDRLARKMLIAAAKGRDEVVIPYNRRRSLLDWVGFGEARRRNLLKTLRGLRG